MMNNNFSKIYKFQNRFQYGAIPEPNFSKKTLTSAIKKVDTGIALTLLSPRTGIAYRTDIAFSKFEELK